MLRERGNLKTGCLSSKEKPFIAQVSSSPKRVWKSVLKSMSVRKSTGLECKRIKKVESKHTKS